MTIENEALIKLRDVWFKYEGQKDYILKEINLKIKRGDILLLLGKSGSGKTTLARIITGLIPHFYRGEFKGEVYINGRSTRELHIYEIADHIGLIRQNPENQILMSTVEREIAFSLEFLGIPREAMKERVLETSNRVGIKHLLPRDVDTLSGGELQKVAIASILVRKPHTIILDEPSAYLSPSSVKQLRRYIMALRREGMTFLIIDHRLDYWLDIANRIVVIDSGIKIFDGDLQGFLNLLEEREIGLNIPIHIRLAIEVNKYCGEKMLPLSQDVRNIFRRLEEVGI